MDPRIEEAQELVTSLRTKCQIKKEKLLRKERSGSGASSKRGNNNDEYFESNYASDGPADHRSSSSRLSSNSADNSNESAFSSASEDGSDESETNCEERSFSSASSCSRSSSSNDNGVSSVDRRASSDSPSQASKQLNTCSNLVPNDQRAHELIEQVRQKFVESLQSDERDHYELADLNELENADSSSSKKQLEEALSARLISRFINFKHLLELDADADFDALENALDEATNKLREMLQFRHQYKLTNVLDEHFSKEIHLLHGIFPFGYDKNNLPVLYLRARVHRRWSRELDETFRRYVAWQVNLLTKSYPGASVQPTVGRNGIEKDGSFGICFDCLHVSYSCVDMDFLSYLVKILVNYYPTYCRYALCVDLPWLFRSVWKIVRSWLPEEARNTVHLITSKQLTEFIDEEQIPNSMRVNDLPAREKPSALKHRMPKNFDSIQTIDHFAKDLSLSSSELKQFKTHVEKVCKEYEQLGAM